MKQLRNWIAGVPFCMALIGLSAFAAPANDRYERAHRYYDGDYKDYHTWNNTEQRSWRGYWSTERRPYVSWDRASEAQRRAYWRWRHERERRHNYR